MFLSLRSSIEEDNETLEEESPPQSHVPPPENIVNVIKMAPSPQASSFTVSSSTTVGTSMFDLISEGEHLWPDSIIPGLYSDGEYPLSEGQAVLTPIDEIDDGK